MAAVKRAPRELDPFARGRSPTCTPRWGRPSGGGPSTRRVREYERALALCPTFLDLRTELGETRAGDGGAVGGLSVGSSSWCGPRARDSSPETCTSVSAYYAEGRHEDAAAEWRAVLAEAAGATGRRGCTWRCSSETGPGKSPRASGPPSGHPSEAVTFESLTPRPAGRPPCSTFTSTPASLHSSRRSRPTIPPGEGEPPFSRSKNADLTTFDAIARIARAFGLAPGTSATPA